MKKFLVIMVTLMIVILPVQTFALDIPKIKINVDIPDSFWDEWFEEHPIQIPDDIEIPEDNVEPEPEPEKPVIESLRTPVVSKAKYVHKTRYYGQNKHLEISWNEVENAEFYEVLITKADKTTVTYTTSTNMIYDKYAKCPKVYVKKWTAATVKVRAVAGDIVSSWSAPVKISCDKLH